ncbi:unnamed protein product [Sphagnum balticum]
MEDEVPVTINLIGDTDEHMYSNFIETLGEIEESGAEEVYVELNSTGGDVYVAIAIASRMRLSKLRFNIGAFGIVGSSAVIILASGTYRSMAKEAWALVHEDGCEYEGRVSKLEKYAKHQRRMEDQWNALLAERTKTDAKTWGDLHKASTYLDAQECLALGLVDEVI